MVEGIEEALKLVAQKYGFSAINIGVMDIGSSYHTFSAAVHWRDGKSVDGNPCESCMSDVSVQDALDKAIDKANENRAPFYTIEGALPSYSFGGIVA